MTDGGLLAAAGFLLLVPGFVTDVFGLALLVPAGARRRAPLARAPVHRAHRPGAAGAGPDYLDVDEARGRVATAGRSARAARLP